ncbi:hypothetical protein, partial [Salinicola sp. MIT1003]|uniref:hypothetical protein n=1 Tax=Salinicola sp. MIT1003 TaxID=1882734 RepID=UPI001B35478E
RRGAQEISRWTEHPSIALRLELETAFYLLIGFYVIWPLFAHLTGKSEIFLGFLSFWRVSVNIID